MIFGLFVAGMWRIDRLDPAKHRVDIGSAPPPPPAASGSPTPKAQVFTPKRHITHDIVLPVQHVTVATSDTTSEIPGTGSGTGSGSGSDTENVGPCTENCGPGSAAAPPVVVQAPTTPIMVAPTLLRGLRISGETQIQASESIKSQLLHEGRSQLSAMFKVCIDTGGSVGSIGRLRSTGYPEYDDQLAGAIRTWRYRPYMANNVPIPVCGVVTFNYSMK